MTKNHEINRASTNEQVVAIIQRRLTHYRVPLFERLRDSLAEQNIRLRLVHGEPTEAERSKRDEGQLDWAEKIRNTYVRIGKTTLCWQHLPEDLDQVDLVILTQENSILSNLPWLLRKRQNGPRIAFWGHGANFQSASPRGIKESFKRWTTNRVDWWFAYTDLSTSQIAESGFPASRTTTLNNAIDTVALAKDLESTTTEDIEKLRQDLGLKEGRTGIFIGSLYPQKRLDFLITAAIEIRDRLTDFSLIIVGDGPERQRVAQMASLHPWIHVIGALHGREKAKYLRCSDVILNPGLVGLGILDSFSAGVPLITTEYPFHSPEIAYLRHRTNGIRTQNCPTSYASETVHLLTDPETLRDLRNNLKFCAARYSLYAMNENFASGIYKSLKNS
ncbi:glycosyltransferase family 4 protein [Pseudazoarcus pumilus]|uniref:Glycosyl transferase group 1 n=1 Tax=Pseudazoarcus pumilus TaxID=2067960 RepID=A0A2I6S908_9RHOO|nr:glycosyltransferase family 4 protein [Pseudazoarcus pumilus]AUN95711.1 glycosyl transferase group 1 [Pseudazoarcus pumilus]